MEVDCTQLVGAYVDWLKAKITTADINGACEITTPFLDRHNDRIQIYVQKLEDRIRLTDDGYIIGDLEASGCQIDTPNRRRMLETILNGFGVRQEGGELFVEATPQEFPKKKHALIQAMLTVNDMFMTSKHQVTSLFIEDVRHFLDEHEVRNSPQVEFTGKSGYLHRFDFVIPKSKKKPERLLRAINHPSRDSATSLLFAWTDTKDIRPPNSLAYAVLNDAEDSLSPNVLAAFQHYDVRTIQWSHREQFIDELAA
jgi:Domain of unknown function DUF1828/Domain of unknown function DUF1829